MDHTPRESRGDQTPGGSPGEQRESDPHDSSTEEEQADGQENDESASDGGVDAGNGPEKEVEEVGTLQEMMDRRVSTIPSMRLISTRLSTLMAMATLKDMDLLVKLL